MWIGILAVLLGGGVTVVVSRRARSGRLERNHLAGLRTTATLVSDAAWRRAHEVAGGRMQAAGWLLVGTGVTAAGVALAGAADAGVGMTILAGTAIATGVLLWGCVAGHRAARDLTGE